MVVVWDGAFAYAKRAGALGRHGSRPSFYGQREGQGTPKPRLKRINGNRARGGRALGEWSHPISDVPKGSLRMSLC
jgi:hypothetical protein